MSELETGVFAAAVMNHDGCHSWSCRMRCVKVNSVLSSTADSEHILLWPLRY